MTWRERELEQLRTETVAELTGRGVVTRVPVDEAGRPIVDPITGVSTPVQVYPDPARPESHPWAEGPCRVRTQNQYESKPRSEGRVWVIIRAVISFPAGAFQIRDGDLLTLDNGQRWRLVGEAPTSTDHIVYKVFGERKVG